METLVKTTVSRIVVIGNYLNLLLVLQRKWDESIIGLACLYYQQFRKLDTLFLLYSPFFREGTSLIILKLRTMELANFTVLKMIWMLWIFFVHFRSPVFIMVEPHEGVTFVVIGALCYNVTFAQSNAFFKWKVAHKYIRTNNWEEGGNWVSGFLTSLSWSS